ncbi:ZYBA0S07-03356g1_1 [Zygosaccharomyces bailii CLIB 213]|uniref:ZYBA0S07-03356g1_1 n=1 Tax=Zygosaccharomyces bailii (strain CLIB 213 / ATCC 58445 / CBS 680 / BCRC 21525 / NBRC 1098 / NCYC 1416 / NRRL Y-2227) TaxID=1333698 RepID=A0A8J2X9L6_ZYGB2|nr:ZYBA0S07-03356g1_1 [Zygosaccharomyces bailii CLIB 213]
MIDKLPLELFNGIASLLSQEDKVTLTYVSKNAYQKIVVSLYANLYLNVKQYFPSDFDRALGTRDWSVLYFTSYNDKDTTRAVASAKLAALIRSLRAKPDVLPPLVRRVQCTWHLDKALLNQFVGLLVKYDSNLSYFENFLDENVATKLSVKGDQMQSLVVTPPTVLPTGIAGNNYYAKMEVLLSRYRWDNLQNLTLHVNATNFFPHLKRPLRIRFLSLNLRPDTLGGPFLYQPYDHIFDPEALQSLELLSWYGPDQVEFNLYELWNLENLWAFHNIKELTLLSLPADRYFLSQCITNFPHLQRLKVDYMLDVPLTPLFVESMFNSPCAKTLKDIDIKFEELDVPLVSIDQDEVSNFKFNLNCKCPECRDSFQEIILRKYFAKQNSLIIQDFTDVEARNFTLQLFKLYPILPYTHFIAKNPSIGFYCKSLEAHAEKINELLQVETPLEKVTAIDVRRLYHMHVHSLKKSWNFFLQRFPNLRFLTLNDIPTKILQIDKQQKCNVPIFYSVDYKSNQVYELIDDESLFD